MSAGPTTPPASRDDQGTTPARAVRACPVCASPFTPTGRQGYCSSRCRKTAYRRRHTSPTVPDVPAGLARRTVSAYQCPDCGERLLGAQRCPDCNTFGRALGLAGTCPHCDGIISTTDLDHTS